MRYFKRKDRWEFEKADYSEDRRNIPNPGRGWYRIYTHVLGEAWEEPVLSDTPVDAETLVLLILDIGAFRSRELSTEALSDAARTLDCFKRAGKEVILRVVYDREGKGMEKEPALCSIVQSHMKKLGPVVADYADTVCLHQGLFVGSWGEMHGSKFLSGEQLAKLLETWDEATGRRLKIAFRRPRQVRMTLEELPQDCRIGFFDDAVFGSPDHLGTFGSGAADTAEWKEEWGIDRELAFAERLSRHVPCGGEAVSGEADAGAEETVNMLKRMHITYLNCIHDGRILNRWKHMEYEGWKSLYDYIGAHLGYRFRIRDAQLTGKEQQLKVILENTGFASICEPVDTILVLEHENGQVQRVSSAFDLRSLNSQEQTELLFQLSGETGERFFCSMELVRSRDGKNIRFSNADAGNRMFIGVITVPG